MSMFTASRMSLAAKAVKKVAKKVVKAAPRKIRSIAFPGRTGLNGFGVLLKKMKGSPKLANLTFKQRARTLGKIWANLSAAEKAVLNKEGQKYVFKPHPARNMKKAKTHAFAKFVKANIKKVKNVKPTKRMAALAKIYRAKRK